jgi:NAD(P)-dependent dehydrogenase (short-subunit alcohol dehydrogenase family)
MPESSNPGGPPRAALVTGGVRRIGQAICVALAQAGYAVAVHGHRPETEADDMVARLSAEGVRSAYLAADLSDPHEVAGLVERAEVAVGPLSLLVNCASVFEDDAVGGLDPAGWERHFAVNLRAPVFLAQAFAARVREGDACIVNITDQRARKLVPRQFTYTLTKSALEAATVMLAQALAPRVRVNAVAPGPTLPSPRQDAQAFAQQQAGLPLASGPRPEDIAAAVLYLASAQRVTGETLAVDGGQHIAWKTPDAWGFDE